MLILKISGIKLISRKKVDVFKEQNLNIIVEVHDDFSVEVEENYCWMTLNQMLCLVNYNNFLNIAARSLLSAVQFYK